MPAAAASVTFRRRHAPYRPRGAGQGVYVISRREQQARNKTLRPPTRRAASPVSHDHQPALPHQEQAPAEVAAPQPAVVDDDVFMADVGELPPTQPNYTIQLQLPPPKRRRGRRVKRVPTQKKWLLYQRWDDLLPKLQQPLLEHMAGRAPRQCARCTVPGCTESLRRITCVEWDKYTEQHFVCCPHNTLAAQLVARGFFPSSPELPTYAFSMKLLDFYYHLWFHSADSAMAATAVLHGFHADLGFVLKNAKGEMIDEGQLDHTVEDIISAKRRWDAAWNDLETRRTTATAAASAPLPTPPVTPPSTPHGPNVHGQTAQAEPAPAVSPSGELPSQAEATAATARQGPRTQCSEYLVSCCPMCFEEQEFGRGVDQGCDIHVGGDANFSQRHNCTAGDSPPFKFRGVYQLSPDRVAAMEAKLEAAGKRPRRQYRGGVVTAVPHGDRG
ncbi:hypothetical protein AURDEDRAFT_164780 [Auricularia subglabra TFB-10046 SS5]|nr:hypothetical protein AURDEDRAFT_164780 [Auricularia subglabra TFB-10046 SS5]